MLAFDFWKEKIKKYNGFVTDGPVEKKTSFFDRLDPDPLAVTKPLHI